MRKLLAAGILLSVLILACETKTPSGPEGLTLTTSTTTTSTPPPPGVTTTSSSSSSTTTSIVLGSLAASYKAFPPPPPNVPSEVTLFLKLLTVTATAPADRALASLGFGAGVTEIEYSVTGVYVMGNGTTGTIAGELGGSMNPLETGGEFDGSLTARTFGPSGCTGQRDFAGTLSTQNLNWVGGAAGPDQGPNPCASNPLMAFSSMSMLRSDPSAPLPTPPPTSTTTSAASTTTSSVNCTYSLKPSSDPNVPSSGGARSVAIGTQAGCGWSAQSFADWISINPPFGGSGPATVTYNVAANSSGSRTGRLVIAGIDFLVTQDAALPDLTPLPVTVACTTTGSGPSEVLNVAVRVRNVGAALAGASTTRVVFTTFSAPGPVTDDTPTGAIAAGGATGSPANPDPVFSVNADSCFADLDENGTEDCNFTITVDVGGAVTESNETAASNQAPGQCSRDLGELAAQHTRLE